MECFTSFKIINMESRMIFCVIQPPTKDTSHITKEIIISFYSEFGPIKDVEIFSRKIKVKAFIEFHSNKSAKSLVQKYPVEFTNYLGKNKVFLSEKESIFKKKQLRSYPNISHNSLSDFVLAIDNKTLTVKPAQTMKTNVTAL